MNFDGAGQQISTQDARGYLSTTVFDNAGRVQASVSALGYRTTRVYDGASQPIATEDSLGYLHTSVFDALGRSIASVDPLGSRFTPVFDNAGQYIAAVDALANRMTTVYDTAGRTIASQDARGYLNTFVLDAAGQQIALLDARNNRSTTMYDARGMQYATQDQLGAFTSYVFDGAGNAIRRTDARSWVTTYSVDALNRQSGGLYRDGTRFTYTWDAVGRQITMQDVTGVTTSGYDARGLQTSVAYPTGKRLTYTFDPNANRLSLLDPDSKYVTYSWDAQNRLRTILNQFNEYTTFSYDSLDREQKRVLGNGIAISHIFDAGGRELVLENRRSSGAGLSVYTATYDVLGNRLTVQELDGTRVTYLYDPAYQLLNEQRSGLNAYNISYSFDALGNRLAKNDFGALTTGTFDAGNRLILLQSPSGQPTTSSYDANGNLMLDKAGAALATYTWDSSNRLITVSDTTGVETYTYSADGLRKQKATPTTTVFFVRDNQNVLVETDINLVTQATYTDLPSIWGGKYSLRRSGASSFYVPDYQGNTRHLTDITQVVTDSLTVDAWGREIQSTGSAANPFKSFGKWGYYQDSSTRLHVCQRTLCPVLGRFISRDPLPFNSHKSRYTYVDNDPVSNIDPSGMIIIRPVQTETGWCIGESLDQNCCCGKFVARWDFEFQQGYKGNLNYAPCDGWFVQEVTWILDAESCDGTDKPPIHIRAHYWEAWHATHLKPWADERREHLKYTDAFYNLDQYRGYEGSAKIKGEVRYFCDEGNLTNVPWKEFDYWHFSGCYLSGSLICHNGEQAPRSDAEKGHFGRYLRLVVCALCCTGCLLI